MLSSALWGELGAVVAARLVAVKFLWLLCWELSMSHMTALTSTCLPNTCDDPLIPTSASHHYFMCYFFFCSLQVLIWAKDWQILGSWIQIPNFSTVCITFWDPGLGFPRGEISITENCGNLPFKHFFHLSKWLRGGEGGSCSGLWPPRNFSKSPGIMGICSVCFEEVFQSCWDHTWSSFWLVWSRRFECHCLGV